jgi:hypothetical protein
MYVVSASYEAGGRQAPRLFSSLGHTIIEAAEQALPTAGPAQAAGSHPQTPSRTSHRTRELWLRGRRSMAPTHLLSVPMRCISHQRLPA